jgi:hypothetical protein
MAGKREKEAMKEKKPYVKPEVRRVPLRPEEAVLGGCKAAAGGAGSGGSCNVVLCLTQAS